MKSIKFIIDKHFSYIIPPIPSSKMIPKWHRDGETYLNKDTGLKQDSYTESAMAGMKACMPFFDAIASGYMLRLWTDIEITKNSEGSFEFQYIEKNDKGVWIKQSKDPDAIAVREGDVGYTIPRPHGYAQTHLVWKGKWGVELPKGWSMLYTHPLNQYNLPFLSLSGIIDSDTFSPSGNLPFFIQEGWTGIIEKGTPIIQLIPIKRSDWLASIKESGHKESFLGSLVRSKNVGVYKKSMWHPKRYKVKGNE